MQHVRNCPIDCASIYYNGVRRSGIYTVVPSLGAMPVEVYCDMDTDGNYYRLSVKLQFLNNFSAACSLGVLKTILFSRVLF